MTKTCLAFAALRAAGSSAPEGEDAAGAVTRELQAIAREMMDAVAGGGREVWERRLAPQVSCVDPDGTLKDRAAVLAELRPLPDGVSGRIDLSEPALTLSGDTAILTYRARETEQGFGRRLSAAYRVSDVYVRRDGRWLLLGSQATRLP
jgi:hypothetical protein